MRTGRVTKRHARWRGDDDTMIGESATTSLSSTMPATPSSKPASKATTRARSVNSHSPWRLGGTLRNRRPRLRQQSISPATGGNSIAAMPAPTARRKGTRHMQGLARRHLICQQCRDIVTTQRHPPAARQRHCKLSLRRMEIELLQPAVGHQLLGQLHRQRNSTVGAWQCSRKRSTAAAVRMR